MDRTDRRASVHEAGHALVGRLLGRRVTRVQIDPRPETKMKRTRPIPVGKPKSPSQRAYLEGEIMIALGGLAAERTLLYADGESLRAAHEDLNKASSLALQLAGRARAEPTVFHFLSVTERMLRARLEVLRNTAQALAEARSLDESELAELMPRE